MRLTPKDCNLSVALVKRGAYITQLLAEGGNIPVLVQYVAETHEAHMEVYHTLAQILPTKGMQAAPGAGTFGKIKWHIGNLRHLFIYARVARAIPALVDIQERLRAIDARFEI